jgi:hypothetical protein
MTGLIDETALRASQEKYFAEHPTPAMILIRTAKANPTANTTELALIVGRSRSWVRKILKANAVTAARAGKGKTR